MTKNKLSDLNNLLFEQMERLGDADSTEELEKEVKRSDAMTDISGKVIENASLALKAAVAYDERSAHAEIQLLEMLQIGGGSDGRKELHD